MTTRDELIRLGEQLGRERDKALQLWTWLPSYEVAKRHHGDYADEFMPSIDEIMSEACKVMAQAKGYELSEEEQEWLAQCPCGEGCESKGC
tara:strand:+ start:15299 stop:15571 length:273 start_codon:yes stop_codon:yes gene_type:complete